MPTFSVLLIKIIKSFLICLVLLLLLSPLSAAAESSTQVDKADVDQSKSSQLQSFGSLLANWSNGISVSGTAAIISSPIQGNVVYLTFDDGPDEKWTPLILEQLAKHDAKATFFMIGINASSEPETVLAVAAGGHTIGNHSFNHVSLAYIGWSYFNLEITDTNRVIRDALSSRPALLSQVAQCIRPPFGEVSPDFYNFASRLNYDISMWSLDTRDWQGLSYGVSAEVILDTVLEGLEPGSIILMHDGGKDRSETVSGLGLVLHELIMRGYTFQPLCNADGQVIVYP